MRNNINLFKEDYEKFRNDKKEDINDDLCYKDPITKEKKFLNLNRFQWGWVGVATNGVSVFFQLYNLFKTNKAQSFDMGFIFLMTILNAVYCIMGLLTLNWGMFVATGLFVFYNLCVMFIYYYGKQK
tara:strand:+ start:1068 stop:1448 length:381 start_codon:yes stop_codon:yes gene_type:complete